MNIRVLDLSAFEGAQRSVEEPPDGSNLVVSLPVTRKGGTVGVVMVTWEASLTGQSVYYYPTL